MNEAQTRAELIDPQLKQSGWGEIEDSKILREYSFTAGKIQTGGKRAKPLKADYMLVYKNQKLADWEELKKSILQKAFNGELHETAKYNPNIRLYGSEIGMV